MKTSLKIILFLLGATSACAAFAGLIGFATPAYFSGEVILPLFAVIGLMLIGVADYAPRRSIQLRRSLAPACPVKTGGGGRRSRAYGIRRQACPVA